MSKSHPAVLDKIRRLREKRGYSQEYVADRLRLSKSAYQRLENGEARMDIGQFQAVAEVLETDPMELLGSDAVVVNVAGDQNGSAAGYNAHVEHNIPEEFVQRMLDRYDARHDAHVKELQEMNKRLLALLEGRK